VAGEDLLGQNAGLRPVQHHDRRYHSNKLEGTDNFMRVNIYSQELMTGPEAQEPTTESVNQTSNTGVIYSAVRLFLHSSYYLHHPPADDDRSALTFWLPRSPARRARFAQSLRDLARLVEAATPETGAD
jgi:hypothetical protein